MSVAVVASIVLGAVMLVAGGTKIAVGPAWPAQAAALGAPVAAVPVVPWIEIVIGALLVAQVGEPAPALAAMVLLVAFSVLLVVQLAHGRHPPCACFGGWSTAPLGGRHVARNAALLALAVMAAFG